MSPTTGRLGDQRDVGTVPRRPERDRQADAAAASGDEQGLARKRHRCLPFPAMVRIPTLITGWARSNSLHSG